MLRFAPRYGQIARCLVRVRQVGLLADNDNGATRGTRNIGHPPHRPPHHKAGTPATPTWLRVIGNPSTPVTISAGAGTQH